MRKINFFLLGLLLSFLMMVPFFIGVASADDCYEVTTGYEPPSSGSGVGVQIGDYMQDGDGHIRQVVNVINLSNSILTSIISSNPLWAPELRKWRYYHDFADNKSNGQTDIILSTTFYDSTITQVCGEEPSTCSNGDKDGDEEGRDCGGSCSADCISVCPEGTYLWDGFDSGPDKCIQEVPTDNYGNCPDLVNWTHYPAGSGYPAMCSRVHSEAELAKEGIYTPAPALDPWNNEPIQSDSTTTISAVDNGDGTSTQTTTTTKTTDNGDGTTTTTTTTTDTTVDNSTGEIISSTTTETTEETGESDGTAFDDERLAGEIATTRNVLGTKLDEVKTSVDGLTEEADETKPDTMSEEVEGYFDDAMDDIDGQQQSEIDGILADYGSSASRFPVSEGISALLDDWLPSRQAPTDYIISTPRGDITIKAEMFQRIQDALSFLFFIWTLTTIFEVLTDTKAK